MKTMVKRSILIVFQIMLLGNHSNCQNGKWAKEISKLPVYYQWHSSAALDGNIYIIGGCLRTTSDIFFSKVYEKLSCYNLSEDQWIMDYDTLPIPRGQLSSLNVNSKIYILGGVNFFNRDTRGMIFDVFIPATKEWSKGKALPPYFYRYGSSTCAIDSCIYIIGGTSGVSEVVDHMDVYDLHSEDWKSLKPLPHPLSYSSPVVLGKEIYLIGGDYDTSENPKPVFLKYDTEKDCWNTELTNIPKNISNTGAWAFGGYIYVFGGRTFPFRTEEMFEGSSSVFMYDPREDFWLTVSEMPVGLWGMTIHEIDGRIYLLGGIHSTELEKEKSEGYFPAISSYTPVQEPIYSILTKTSSYSFNSKEDSCLISAQIINHKNYPVEITARLKRQAENQAIGLELYDDGEHDDKDAKDGLYAGYFKHPGVEDIFDISIVSHNLDLKEEFYSGQDCRSICTIGPVEIDSCHITGTETTNTGEKLVKFTIDLINTGKSTPAEDLSIELFSVSDPIIMIDKSSDFKTIKPGETGRSKSEFSMSILPGQYSSKAKFHASICLNGTSYWNEEYELQIDW